MDTSEILANKPLWYGMRISGKVQVWHELELCGFYLKALKAKMWAHDKQLQDCQERLLERPAPLKNRILLPRPWEWPGFNRGERQRFLEEVGGDPFFFFCLADTRLDAIESIERGYKQYEGVPDDHTT